MKQLVYFIDTDHTHSEAARKFTSSREVILIKSFVDAVTNLSRLKSYHGVNGSLLKVLLKCAIPRYFFYYVLDKTFVSDGQVTLGHCRYYDIQRYDYVIGPTYTPEKFRGLGHATFGLVRCLEFLNSKQTRCRVFIDTAETNAAMQKVIEKSGFGHSKFSYERPVGGL